MMQRVWNNLLDGVDAARRMDMAVGAVLTAAVGWRLADLGMPPWLGIPAGGPLLLTYCWACGQARLQASSDDET